MNALETCPVTKFLQTSIWESFKPKSQQTISLTQDQILELVQNSYWTVDVASNSYNYARAHWLNEDEAKRYAEISGIAVRLRNEQEYSEMIALSQKIVDFDSKQQ